MHNCCLDCERPVDLMGDRYPDTTVESLVGRCTVWKPHLYSTHTPSHRPHTTILDCLKAGAGMMKTMKQVSYSARVLDSSTQDWMDSKH
jgi:hypothetical protein